jgi:acid phosphatase type 7
MRIPRGVLISICLLFAAAPGHGEPLFKLPDAQLGNPLVFVVYGDMRFTDPREHVASSPGARRALVARVASEHPEALFLTGDIPWHGGDRNDYQEYRDETAVGRQLELRVFPVLGNHEFAECEEAQCLENWWQAFPKVRGHRWYEVALGSRIRVFALDSDAPLRPASPQGRWLARELSAVPHGVEFVLFALHHPPVADESWAIVRSNERALARYLAQAARSSSARFVVCAAHVHNYERFEQKGIVYLVSGGGGAKPLAVRRSPADRFQRADFPNYHYLRFELDDDRLQVQMIRLVDFAAPSPHTWAVRDRFTILQPK